MKKLARLTALLLTGVMLLLLASCGAVPGGGTNMTPEEIAAKQWLLEEITSYRTTHDPILAPLVEVEQLSKAEQVYISPFRTANTTKLPASKTAETYEEWKRMTKGWTSCDDFGSDGMTVDGEPICRLTAMVPANTQTGNEALQATLRSSGAFDAEDGTSIGIAVVTIKGQMYWTCCIFHK